jgi:hypothetical protein
MSGMREMREDKEFRLVDERVLQVLKNDRAQGPTAKSELIEY